MRGSVASKGSRVHKSCAWFGQVGADKGLRLAFQIAPRMRDSIAPGVLSKSLERERKGRIALVIPASRADHYRSLITGHLPGLHPGPAEIQP
jgi:hypothetical protein